jgi:hypothetical protein
MKASLRRIFSIAHITLLEALRQRVLNVLFVFALLFLGGSNFITQLTFQAEFKFLKDLGYAAISVTGILIALMGAAQLIPAELERRTIFTTLSKPVHRFEFVLGKYLGLIALISLMMLVMCGFFALALYWKEWTMLAPHQMPLQGEAEEDRLRAIREILDQSRDPRLIQGALLIWAKLCVLAAITVFFSTIATSTVFIVATTLLLYLTGHLQSVAREIWLGEGSMTWWKQACLMLVATLVPDFRAFDLIDEIIAGNPMLWTNTAEVLAYSFTYTVVALGLSFLIFESREL